MTMTIITKCDETENDEILSYAYLLLLLFIFNYK